MRAKLTVKKRQISKYKRYFVQCRSMYRNTGLTDVVMGSVGALNQRILAYKRKNLKEYNKNTNYLVGEHCIKDIMQCAVLSSENLLLNQYRQLQMCQDMFFAVDTSYRYTSKLFSLMTVFVVSLDQVGHRVAYAVCNKESLVAHKSVFKNIKRGIQVVVNDCISKGHTYI